MQDNTISIPGYKIEYQTTAIDYLFIAQHNYEYLTKENEIVIRGWYDETLMKACESIVAFWRVKEPNLPIGIKSISAHI